MRMVLFSRSHYKMFEQCYFRVFAFLSHPLKAYWFSLTFNCRFFWVGCLHEQKFVSLLIDAPSDITRACRWCAGLGVSVEYLVHFITPTFHLSSAHFFTVLCTRLGLSHPTNVHFSRCHYGHTIDNFSTHLLQCPCGSERIVAHDTFQDIVAAIFGEYNTCLERVSHLFLCHTSWWVDILITRDSFRTLINIVITDSTCTNMV